MLGSTPLILACEAGHVDVVRDLIESGADVTAENNSGLCSLVYAMRNNHIEIVKFLIAEHGEILNYQTIFKGYVEMGGRKFLKFFIEEGIDLHHQYGEEGNILDVSCESFPKAYNAFVMLHIITICLYFYSEKDIVQEVGKLTADIREVTRNTLQSIVKSCSKEDIEQEISKITADIKEVKRGKKLEHTDILGEFLQQFFDEIIGCLQKPTRRLLSLEMLAYSGITLASTDYKESDVSDHKDFSYYRSYANTVQHMINNKRIDVESAKVLCKNRPDKGAVSAMIILNNIICIVKDAINPNTQVTDSNIEQPLHNQALE